MFAEHDFDGRKLVSYTPSFEISENPVEITKPDLWCSSLRLTEVCQVLAIHRVHLASKLTNTGMPWLQRVDQRPHRGHRFVSVITLSRCADNEKFVRWLMATFPELQDLMNPECQNARAYKDIVTWLRKSAPESWEREQALKAYERFYGKHLESAYKAAKWQFGNFRNSHS